LTYAVIVSRAAMKDSAKLPPRLRDRIGAAVIGLGSNPREGAGKLAGRDLYRTRVGDCRILFRVDDKVRRVEVLGIKHRRDAYRRLGG
jgi:mRNA-degrading endonuclease RelE of RelBE toxin-antitoxin system